MEAKSPAKGLIYGAIASCLAEVATMPIDVVKVRLQYSGSGGLKIYSGIGDCLKKTVSQEGVGALWKGLPPALVRQALYGGLRYGLYAPIRNAIVDPDTPRDKIAFHQKLAAGGLAGALSSFICVPSDLMKVRLQVDGMVKGSTKQYSGMIDCLRKIVAQDGITGMWRGSTPTIARATVLAAVEMSSFDEVKQQLIKNGLVVPGTVSGVFISSVVSGFLCAVTTSPIDVVKSRVMGQPVGADGKGKLYKGMLDCFAKSVKQEGVLSLWKGFLPNWGRLGPRGVICFVTMEQLNKMDLF